jgi:hypothetical protein
VTLIITPAQAIERAALIADEWADENKAAAAKARKSSSEGCQNMAEMLDGAAIECNAIAAEIRKLVDHIHPGARPQIRPYSKDSLGTAA